MGCKTKPGSTNKQQTSENIASRLISFFLSGHSYQSIRRFGWNGETNVFQTGSRQNNFLKVLSDTGDREDLDRQQSFLEPTVVIGDLSTFKWNMSLMTRIIVDQFLCILFSLNTNLQYKTAFWFCDVKKFTLGKAYAEVVIIHESYDHMNKRLLILLCDDSIFGTWQQQW